MEIFHTIFSVLALLAGGVIFFSRKGTTFHVRVGYTYAVSMVGLVITSFFIFDVFGSFGVFHALSIVSFVTLGLGLYFPIFGRGNAGWLEHHYFWMNYSYVGLVMAGGSHLFPLLPEWPGWARALLFWGLPYALGTWWIFRWRKPIIAEVRDRLGLRAID